jgi:6-phosphogluconolactonase
VNTHLPRFLHFADLEDAGEAAASEIARTLIKAVEARSTATLVLAGGSTPHGIHARLADRGFSPPIPWHLVHLFWGDERCVPPNDRNSNYAMARTTLLDRIEIPSENIHRIPGELPPLDAADRHEAELRRHFGDGGLPTFDCIMLGMGADGHTASLFPGDPLIDETERWIGATDGIQASPPVPRVGMTLPVLNTARKIVFVVSGEAKHRVVREIEERVVGFQLYPAARVRAAGSTLWYIASEGRAAPI